MGDYNSRGEKKMNKKFEYVWKVCLIFLLLWGMIAMIGQFKDVNTNAIACSKSPFVWGAKVMADKQPNGHMDCTCRVYGDTYSKPYSFNENQQNPVDNTILPTNTNFINLSNLKIGDKD